MSIEVGGEVTQLKETSSSVHVDVENVSSDSPPILLVSGWRNLYGRSILTREQASDGSVCAVSAPMDFRIPHEVRTGKQCRYEDVVFQLEFLVLN